MSHQIAAGVMVVAFTVYTGSSGKKPDDPTKFIPDPAWMKVEKVEDTDRIQIRLEKGQASVALANVLPLRRWPKDLNREQRQIREDARAFLRKWMLSRKVFFEPARHRLNWGSAQGDLQLRSPEWKFATPAEKTGWGMFHLNALVIQEGYSVYVRDDTVVPGFQGFWPGNDRQKNRQRLLEEAEEYARRNKKGIWKDAGLAARLKAVAKNGRR
jgi:endonuclease YncB( thermonuclease family)